MDLISHIKKNYILITLLFFLLIIVSYFVSTYKHHDNYFKSKVILSITENNISKFLPFIADEVQRNINTHNTDPNNDFIYSQLTYDFSDVTFNLRNNTITFKSTYIFDKENYEYEVDNFIKIINSQFHDYYFTIYSSSNKAALSDFNYRSFVNKMGTVEDNLSILFRKEFEKLETTDFVKLENLSLISSYDHLVIFDYLILIILSLSLSIFLSVLLSVFRNNE